MKVFQWILLFCEISDDLDSQNSLLRTLRIHTHTHKHKHAHIYAHTQRYKHTGSHTCMFPHESMNADTRTDMHTCGHVKTHSLLNFPSEHPF